MDVVHNNERYLFNEWELPSQRIKVFAYSRIVLSAVVPSSEEEQADEGGGNDVLEGDDGHTGGAGAASGLCSTGGSRARRVSGRVAAAGRLRSRERGADDSRGGGDGRVIGAVCDGDVRALQTIIESSNENWNRNHLQQQARPSRCS